MRSDYPQGLLMSLRIEALEHTVKELTGPEATLKGAHSRVSAGATLSRDQVAAILGVSTKKIQRMEAAGTLTRCPGLGTVVRYAARDVLRLASAA